MPKFRYGFEFRYPLQSLDSRRCSKVVMQGPAKPLLGGSIPLSASNFKRDWYIGCAPAFQAREKGSNPLSRSILEMRLWWNGIHDGLRSHFQ